MNRLCAFSFGIVLAVGMARAGNVKADDVDVAVAAQMQQRHILGLALAVIQDGKIVREQGYGYRDGEHHLPVTPGTLFMAGSVSKPVAALGAMHLVEQGKLSLDENINAKLRTWHLPENGFTKDHPVTLRLILCHRAGVTVEGFYGYPVGAPVPSLVQVLDGKAPAKSESIRVDQVPGTESRYSGGGYTVMQQMVMDVTGQRFDDYLEQTVLQPLGMTSSTFTQPLPKAWDDRAATGYLNEPRRPIEGRWTVQPALAAGGLWTTVGDLSRFYIGVQRALAGTSNPIISQALARLMVTEQHDGFGLGFDVGGAPPRFGHNGAETGFRAITVGFASGQGMMVLMNADVDVDAMVGVLGKAVSKQYRWPSKPPPDPAQ